jgi:2-amino-4-hydroxy-6-hydroxymethyldihydropteridine diphosphokinase
MLSLHPRRVVHLSLGGNLGDRLGRLSAAPAALAAHGLEILRVSPVYETAPMYVADQPAFLNMAVAAATALEPEALLQAAQAVERAAGRDRAKETRNGPRTLDIDLLSMEGVTLDGVTPDGAAPTDLTLPHPRMAERAFVLAPLADIAGALVPPGWAGDIDAALDKAPGRAEVRRFAPPPAVFDPPARRDEAYKILLRDFQAQTPDGRAVRLDLDLETCHPGRQFRDDISAVMSYEDIVVGLRRLCARNLNDDLNVFAQNIGDLCLSFPRVIGASGQVRQDGAAARINVERIT